MQAAILFLVGAPVFGAILFIVGVIVSCCSKQRGTGINVQPTPDVPAVTPAREPSIEYPDIADQLDGRLTNIVKDPMKGIL